jgi:hypothetical protein
LAAQGRVSLWLVIVAIAVVERRRR